MSTVVLYCWCHSESASVLLYFTYEYGLFVVLIHFNLVFFSEFSVGTGDDVKGQRSGSDFFFHFRHNESSSHIQ